MVVIFVVGVVVVVGGSGVGGALSTGTPAVAFFCGQGPNQGPNTAGTS